MLDQLGDELWAGLWSHTHGDFLAHRNFGRPTCQGWRWQQELFEHGLGIFPSLRATQPLEKCAQLHPMLSSELAARQITLAAQPHPLFSLLGCEFSATATAYKLHVPT